MKTINRTTLLLLVAGYALICGPAFNLYAQDTNVDWGTASDDQVILQAIELTTPTQSNEVPTFATFYSAQHSPISSSPWPPLPGNMEDFNAWDLGSNIWVLDDLGFDYDASSASSSHSMMAMDAGGLIPGGAGDGGTNDGEPEFGGVTPFDPGTNLWIAQEAVSGGNFSGIISNTIGGIEYQLLYANSLNPPVQWTPEPDGLLVGTDGTNWTPWTVPFEPTTNFFLNVLSLQDDSGTGIPSSWWLEYFGEDSNVNENAPDPAGDGWTDYQKFAMGISPFVWTTPPAPSGFSLFYNSKSQTVTLTWQPSLGNITGYTITVFANYGDYYAQYTTTNTTFVDTSPVTNYIPDYYGVPTYYLQANYTNGNSADDSLSMFDSSTAASAQMVAANDGGANMVLTSPLPAGTAALQLIRIDYDYAPSEGYAEATFNVPASDLSGNTFFLPESDFSEYNNGDYYNEEWYVQTVNTNGGVSTPSQMSSDIAPLFFDGRQQLEQNVNFLLRAANTQFPIANPMGVQWTGYAFSGLYDEINTYPGESFGPYLDKYEPFEENYLYKNLVYSPTNVDDNGFLTTGLQQNLGFGYIWYALVPPLTYIFQPETTNNVIPAVLDPADTPFITFYPDTESDYQIEFGGYVAGYENGPDQYLGLTGGSGAWSFSSPATNCYGLPITSVLFSYNQSGTYETSVLSLGDSNTNINGGGLYWQVASPELQTVGYYFAQPWAELLPGDPNFSVTNVTSTGLVAGFGQTSVFAGYAEQMLLNVNTNIYDWPAYLGQYFEPQAYQVDASGNVTTNSAGTVSPYGEFVATEPGPAALVTMPNYSENVQGTGIVQVVKLVLDVNHDGTMDLSATGPDNTTANTPYVFWANNNADRWDFDYPFGDAEQDDQEVGFPDCPSLAHTPTGDCNYTDANCNRAIPCTRDLEDFARLWVCGVTSNLLAALPPGCTISLNWGDVQSPNPNNPTIDLFPAADPDGGIGYQTNEEIATAQTENLYYPCIGRIGPGSNLVLNASTFANNWAGNYYIWCGVSNGTGGLNLTIANSNGTVLAQTTTYIQIEDIKQMYERWTVGDNPNLTPATQAIPTTEGLQPGVSAFTYPLPQNTNTTYILWVHGYNMPPWVKDTFGATAYKRLYWQGYQGRFGSFGWPTAQNAVQFGASEIQAWTSAQGLLNKLNDLNEEYPGKVYLLAHSLGNVVAGEALRLAGSNQVVNTYIAMQGAVTSHAYDPTTTAYTLYNDDGCPDDYAYYWTNGAPCYFNFSQGAGTYVNFFNVNDWALKFWLVFQNAKPILNPSYYYSYPYEYFGPDGELFFPTNTYELFDKLVQSRSYALGAQTNVGNIFSTARQVELDLPPYNFGTQHIWHSGEYRSDYPGMWQFWNEAMVQMKLSP